MSAKAAYLPTDKRPILTPAPKKPGEWRFVDPVTHYACLPPAAGQIGMLQFACVRRGGICGTIVVGNGLKPPDDTPHKGTGSGTWKWNGRTDRPTLEPSINCLAHGADGEPYAGCGWHAFLTDGEWTGD